MAVVTGAGATGVTFIRRTKAWSQSRGDHYIDEYRGLLAPAQVYYDSIRGNPAYDEVTFVQEKGVATVAVTVQDDIPGGGGASAAPALNEYWEVLPMDLYKGIRAHETFNALANQDALEKARLLFEEARGGMPAGALAQTYITLLRMGTSEYKRSQFILQRTIEIGRRSQIAASWAGVDRAQRVNVGAGPAPPTAIIGAIDDHPDWDNTKKQFLKSAPMIQQITSSKYRIIESWWFARRWSFTLYAGDVEDGNP